MEVSCAFPTALDSPDNIALAERLPNSELIPLYPDAGHGGIFQDHEQFVRKALEFLTA